MPAISRFPIRTLLSQFNRRDHTENQGGDDSDVKSPVVLVGLVIAALTLLVAVIVPLFRSPRFRRWVFSFSISSLIKFYNPTQKALGTVTLPNPRPIAIATEDSDDLSAIPLAEIPILRPVLIYNDYSNTQFVGTHSNTAQRGHNFMTRGDGRVLQVEESLGPRRLQPVVTWPVS